MPKITKAFVGSLRQQFKKNEKTKPHSAFTRVLKECARWGVEPWHMTLEEHLKYVISDEPGTNYRRSALPAPMTSRAGLLRSGRLFWCCKPSLEMAATLIHELVHVIAWRERGEHPDEVDEADYMPAIGIEMHRRLRVPLRYSLFLELRVSRYLTGTFTTSSFEDLSTAQIKEGLKRSMLSATRKGLMKNGKPTYCHHYDLDRYGKRHTKRAA